VTLENSNVTLASACLWWCSEGMQQ